LIIHQVHTSKHLRVIQQADKDNVILPKNFIDEEVTESLENEFNDLLMDDEKLLEIHKMLVTNKFVPLSRVKYKANIINIKKFRLD
jgi:hypothetical protein